jgi:hypothetical protein
MNIDWPLATDPSGSVPKNFLASTADLVGILAHLAGSGNSHSSRHRLNQQFAQAALSNLLNNTSTRGQPPQTAPVVPVAAQTPAPRRVVAGQAARTPRGRIPAGAKDGRSSSPHGRQHCECGQCKRCLDNLRWGRIYDEKFADPTYYGGIVVRHNSTLAEAR